MKIGDALKATASLWQKHRVSRVGAALSFYAVFSLAPLILTLVVLSRLLLGPQYALHAVEAQLQPLLGSKGTQGVDVLVRAAQHKISATPLIVGAGLVLLSVGAIFMQLQEALDDVWGIPEKKRGGFWEIVGLRLHVLILIAALLVFALVSLLAVAAAGLTLAAVVNIAALIIFLTLTYRVLPRTNVGWRSGLLGALVTGGILLIGEVLISVYFDRFHPEAAYGSAGSFIIVLIWIYYSTQSVLVRGGIDARFGERRRSGIDSGRAPVVVFT